MPYSHTSWGELKAALADRLGDPLMRWHNSTELGLYLADAMRTWALATGYWKERGVFATVNGTAFYALQTQLAALLGHTVTDRNMIEMLQYHLLEPATSQVAWTGTEMYSFGQVVEAVRGSRDRLLYESGSVLSTRTEAMPAPPINRVPLTDTVMDVRRALWRNVAAVTRHLLWREDEWGLSAFLALWESSPQTPYAYSVTATRPVELLVAPSPPVVGELELVTVESGADLDPAVSATALGVPDNLAPVVKWGALVDLLRGDGQEADPTRAEVAEKRWNEGVELAKMAQVLIHANVAGNSVLPVSLFDLDAAYGSWQDTSGAPVDLAIAGPNLLALRPVPDGVYAVTLDVARNAPIPAADGEQVQLGREDTDPIIDLAEYLALFKVGGAELQAAEGRLRAFYEAASEHNAKLRANTLFADTIFRQPRREETDRPRRVEVANE